MYPLARHLSLSPIREHETSNYQIVSYGKMLEHFKQLTYPDKLSFFHTHFGIIPFLFPDFDTEISWYNIEAHLSLLTENFYRERPKKFICEKTLIEDECIVKFTVQPVTPIQRILYNRFIIASFFCLNDPFKQKFERDLQNENNPVEFLTSQINILTTVKDWVRCSVNEVKVKKTLRSQFLQIFLSGLYFYNTGKQVAIQQRRKFVELYLFSQGLFFADHLLALQRLLAHHMNTTCIFHLDQSV